MKIMTMNYVIRQPNCLCFKRKNIEIVFKHSTKNVILTTFIAFLKKCTVKTDKEKNNSEKFTSKGAAEKHIMCFRYT